MSVHEQSATAILTSLPEGTVLGEMLLFPGIRSLGIDAHGARDRLIRVVELVAREDSAAERLHRFEPAASQLLETTIEIAPRRNLIGWEEALTLRLPIVRWNETADSIVGYLPSVGIEIVARSDDELLERAGAHVRLVLNRMRVHHDLRLWVQFASQDDVKLSPTTFLIERSTPLESARKRAARPEEDEQKSELARAASDLTMLKLEPAYEIDPMLNRLAEALTASHRRPILLVGPSGVGKTALAHELVRQRARFGLDKTRFYQSDGPRLVAGMTGFGMWQERCTQIIREARRADAVLLLGNLVELMQVGQHEGNEQGIASFFKPYLMRGEFRAIVECTDQQRKLIELQDPHLLAIFEEMPLREPEQAVRRRILSATAAAHEKVRGVSLERPTLARLDDLHQRFATYSVAPGRPLRFLRNLMRTAPRNQRIGAVDVTRAFARETGLPLFMIDPTVRFDPEEARDWFGGRVIGQREAVDRIIDMLTIVKANLSRAHRPIASFMFVGPTGVGKTQMAKSLAEYLFGDADRMTRFDMSEYNDPVSVIRLTQAASASGASQAGGEGLLTAKIREQPFGVLLFDEFEKADPSFFDLLLQVLGEGRLTDGSGRLADFTNAVIIMTSNLGAQSFAAEKFGFADDSPANRADHFLEVVRDSLRPELFNRIDRIVSFRPLDRGQVRSIAEREFDRVRQRDGLALRGVDLNIEASAIDHLVALGFGEKLGARPLQRAIERHVLAPLADRINRFGSETPLDARVAAADGELQIDVHAAASTAAARQESTERAIVAPYAEKVMMLRRKAQRLLSCSATVELSNEVERLKRLQSTLKAQKRSEAWTDPQLHALPRLEEMVARVHATYQAIESAEDDLAARLYADARSDRPAVEVAEQAETIWRRALFDVYCRRFRSPDELLIALYGERPGQLLSLVESYRVAAANEGIALEFALLFNWDVGGQPQPKQGNAIRIAGDLEATRPPTEFKADQTIVWQDAIEPLTKPVQSIAGARTFGIILRATGPYAAALFAGESGVHRFRARSINVSNTCLVDTSGEALHRYQPPPHVETNVEQAIEGVPTRRAYDSRSATVDDKLLEKRTGWSLERCTQTLCTLMPEARDKVMEDMIAS